MFRCGSKATSEVTGLSLLYPNSGHRDVTRFVRSCKNSDTGFSLGAVHGWPPLEQRLFAPAAGLQPLRTKFRCRHFIFSRRYTRFSIRQGLEDPATCARPHHDFAPRLSAAWRRLSASCALSDALLHMDCARASVARTCSSISLKSSAARNTRFSTVLPWSPGKERVKLCRSSSLSKEAFVCTAAFAGTRST